MLERDFRHENIPDEFHTYEGQYCVHIVDVLESRVLVLFSEIHYGMMRVVMLLQ